MLNSVLEVSQQWDMPRPPVSDHPLIFAYAGGVPSTCRVSFEDGAGVTHTVSVAASSLYEAAALGVAELKRCRFAMAAIARGTRLKIAVEAPVTMHELSVSRLDAWLGSSGKDARGAGDRSTLATNSQHLRWSWPRGPGTI